MESLIYKTRGGKVNYILYDLNFFGDREFNVIKNLCMTACRKKALRAANFEVRLICSSDNKVNQIQFLEASLGKFCT